MQDNFTKTLQIGTYVNEHVDAPSSGVLLGYANYAVGTVIQTTCIVDFQIPAGATFYMQHGGSDGAEVYDWEGPDNFQDSQATMVRFKVRRTGPGSAVPVYLFATDNDYVEYTMQITCYSEEVTD